MTKPRRIKPPEIKTEVIPFEGGINEAVSSLELKAGELIICNNYYITEGAIGGYKSLPGYERYDGQPKPSGVAATSEDDTDREAARALIDEVPGIGSVLAVVPFGGHVYAFRNKVGGLTAGMYEDSALGWVEVDTSADALAPGGTYVFSTYHYEESIGTVLLWANGVDNARVFDGTTVTTIVNTGMGASDTPTFLVATWDRVLLGYVGGSVQMSNVGTPLDWSTGTVEWVMGFEITSMTCLLNDNIVVTGRSKIRLIQRPIDSTDFPVVNFSDVVGAIPYTVQTLFDTLIFVNDSGITTLQATQDYGAFSTSSVSEKIKSTLIKYKDNITATIIIKRLNQYRVYFDNGKFIILTFYNKKLRGITKCQYIKPVYTIQDGVDSSNNPTLFFTSNDGFVYEGEVGTSFDGEAIVTRASTAFYHYKSPRNWKRFLQVVLEVNTVDDIMLTLRPAFDYLESGVPTSVLSEFYINNAGSTYGGDVYGVAIWSGSESTNRVKFRMNGLGSNMSISLFSSSKYNRQHTLQNMISDFTIVGRQM